MPTQPFKTTVFLKGGGKTTFTADTAIELAKRRQELITEGLLLVEPNPSSTQNNITRSESSNSHVDDKKPNQNSEEDNLNIAKAMGGAGVGFAIAGLIASFVGAFGGGSASTLGGAGILLVIGAVLCAYAVHQHNKKHENDEKKQIKFTKKGLGLASVIFGLFLLAVLTFAHFSTGALIFAAVLVGTVLLFAGIFKATDMVLNRVDKQDTPQEEQENNFNKRVINDNEKGMTQIKQTYDGIKSSNGGKLKLKHNVKSTSMADLRISSPSPTTKKNSTIKQKFG